MSDFLLNINGDLDLAGFDFNLILDLEELTQRITITLRTFKGELFYNTDFGTPYYQEILGKQKDIGIVESVLKSVLISVVGVSKILEFKMDYNEVTRSLIVSFLVLLSTDEELSIEGLVL